MDKYAELRAAVEQKCSAILIEDVDVIRALLAERDALLDQHHRDSKELRRLCAQRDAARKVSKEAGAAVAGLKADRDALREALEWNAGALMAACKAGRVSELERLSSDTETYTVGVILDMAESALAQEQGGS